MRRIWKKLEKKDKQKEITRIEGERKNLNKRGEGDGKFCVKKEKTRLND